MARQSNPAGGYEQKGGSPTTLPKGPISTPLKKGH